MTRLLHFTDMHLRNAQPGTAARPERLSREMPRVLAALTAMLAEIAPDVLVLSGDVLDVPDEVLDCTSPDGRPVDAWIDEARADYRLVHDWFEATGQRHVVIPGNHDHEGAFSEIFGDGGPGWVDAAGLRFFCFRDELGRDRRARRSGDRLAQFEAALADPAHDRPQVHVQHYMIDPWITHRGWHYEYVGADGYKRGLEASGRVHAVLSGHYHPGSLVWGDQGTLYSVPPAFCEPPHPFRVYDIDAGVIRVGDFAVAG